MAKLKCLEKTTAGKKFYKDGYLKVVDNLMLVDENFYEFLLADPEERPEMLQKHAGKDPNTNKFELIELADDQDFSQPISNANCKILAQKDQRKKGGKKGVATMPIPSERPKPPAGGGDPFAYLEDYAKVVHEYYTAGDKASAHKFLFGAMLLTRCR